MIVLESSDIMKKFGSAVILAGGKSSRMGFDKQLITVNKIKLINNIINKLLQEFDEIIIVTNNPEYYNDLKCKVISDEIKGKGPLSGIHVALKNANSEYVYFTACDMPNINIKYIKYIKYKISNDIDACVTLNGKFIEPFNSFYNKKLVKSIEYQLKKEKRSIYALLQNKNCIYIKEEEARIFSPDLSMFLNLNTKEDLNYFIKRIKG